MNEALLSSKNMCWCTPQAFFEELNKEFNFVLDAAATDKTAKCSLYYTPETDGLAQSWNRGGAVFCNPPYGREIGKWVKKAYEESRGGETIVLLIPARTDTSYFHNFIYGKAEIRFVPGRLRFTNEDGNPADPAPFPSMVVIYNRRCKMSNGDLIRKMSNENLVKLFELLENNEIDFYGFCDSCSGDHCSEYLRDWLDRDVHDVGGLMSDYDKVFGGDK